ncbi:hypothetical protein Tco_0247221 [Tanacetum coccineum]
MMVTSLVFSPGGVTDWYQALVIEKREPGGKDELQKLRRARQQDRGGRWRDIVLEEIVGGERNMNGWLIEDEDKPLEHEASDKEVDSDLESTASSKPMLKKTTKAIPDRMFRNCPYCPK